MEFVTITLIDCTLFGKGGEQGNNDRISIHCGDVVIKHFER